MDRMRLRDDSELSGCHTPSTDKTADTWRNSSGQSHHPQSHSDPAYYCSTSQFTHFQYSTRNPNKLNIFSPSLSLCFSPSAGGEAAPRAMAPALTSNSVLLTSAPPRRSSTAIAASAAAPKPNNIPFGIFSKPKKKAKGGGEEEEGDANSDPNPKNLFSVDFKSLVPAVGSASTSSLFAGGVGRRRKDAQTVFVAGAAGQAGARIARSLLRRGFTVRAGVPDLAAAQELARIAAAYKIISPEEAKRLNAVESAFGDPEAIAKAIGPAAKVVVTVGAAEKSPLATAASGVTTDDALQVVRAAELAGVGHVAVVYDAGAGTSTGGGTSTYNVLDGITSFFANLFAQSQALTLAEFLGKVAETDVSYTLIKASLVDDYDGAADGSYGLVVSKEGSTLAGTSTTANYKVSRSQIATLVADVFSNTAVAENKVVVVSTSPSAASKPIYELFSAVPEDGRRKAYKEALAKAKAEEEALTASQKARDQAAEAAKKLEKEAKKLSEREARPASLEQAARERAEAAGTSLENLMDRAKGFGKDFSWEKFSSQLKSSVDQKPAEEKPTKAQIATVRGQARAQKLPPQKAVVRQSTQKQIRQKPLQPDDPKPEVKKVFGGLFKQETIYVDDD